MAIVDTGTTGFVISDTLYDSDELPLPGGAVREVQVTGLTERGATFTLAASRRRPKNKEAEDFPLIVTPVTIPWFDAGYRNSEYAVRRERAARQAGDWRDSKDAAAIARDIARADIDPAAGRGNSACGLEQAVYDACGLISSKGPPHVLLLGLAFLQERHMTIDVDAGRMLLDYGARPQKTGLPAQDRAASSRQAPRARL